MTHSAVVAASIVALAACDFEHGTADRTDASPADSAPLADASIDATPDAWIIDAPPSNCPSDFVAVVGGQPGSRYKFYGAAQGNDVTFAVARTTCTNAGGYLAIPNSNTEIAVFETVSQQQGEAGYWVGITDEATEGQWQTVLGEPATFLPWKPAPNAQPNGGALANCVVGADKLLWDVGCGSTYPFVCECSS